MWTSRVVVAVLLEAGNGATEALIAVAIAVATEVQVVIEVRPVDEVVIVAPIAQFDDVVVLLEEDEVDCMLLMLCRVRLAVVHRFALCHFVVFSVVLAPA